MATVASEGQLVALQRPWYPTGASTLNLYGDYSVDYATIYRTQPNVRRVVDFLAKNIAQLGLKAYRRKSDTERESLARHPLQRTINRPSPHLTRFRYFRGLVSDLAIYDNQYTAKIAAQDGIALQPVPPFMVTLEGGNWIRPDGYKLVGGAGNVTLTPAQVIHFRGYDPTDQRVGLSPMETLRRILAEESAASEYREHFWKNAARIEGVLQHPGKLSPDAATRLRADWQALYSGSQGSGKTAILEEGMQFKETSFSAKDSEYIASRKLSLEEVAGAYQISPPMIGILDEANFGSLTQFHTMLYQDTLGPWLTWIEEEIELQLIPDFADSEDVYVEFNIQEKLKGAFEEQARSMQALVGRPIMTANEGRARFNLPPVDVGDELITPLNVTVGGQASPLDSAPPPKAYIAIVEKHLERVKNAVVGRQNKTGSDDVDFLFDSKRWNRELTSNLLALGSGTSDERMVKAEQAAKSINAIIKSRLSDGFAKGETAERAIAAASLAIFEQEESNAA